jgi:hypothetical protein
MVYVSTKIKKNAAQAYEREEIESKEFGIIKPENLMHPLRDKSEYAFEAYSKDYGEGSGRSIWRAHALMRILPNTDFRTARVNIKNSADEVLSDEVEIDPPPAQKIRFLVTEKTEDEQKRREFWKIVENTKTNKIYELKVSVLEKYLDEYAEKAEEMIGSFTVK